MTNLRKVFLILFLFVIGGCSQAGWIGYYKEVNSADKYINYNTGNARIINFPKHQEMWLEMPRDCSSFKFAGFFTPFTPPIPIGWPRSLAFGKEDDCNYFAISTRPKSTSVYLITNGQNFKPKEISEGSWGYTKYTFPVRAKNIDSGSIIIEKDGEKVEVPFEYKYFKFWY